MNYKINFFCLILGLACLACGGSDSDDSPTPTITAASGIQVFDINNRGNASDIRLFFSSTAQLDQVAEFRIAIVPETQAAQLTVADLTAPGSNAQSAPAMRGQSRLNLDATLNDLAGNAVSNGVSYQLAIATIHASDPEASQLSLSSAFALADTPLQDLYVSNSRGNSVVIIDEVTGELIGNFINPGEGGLNDTQEMIINAAGDFIVTGLGNNALKLYSGTNGRFLRDFSTGYTLGAPTKTKIGPDQLLYVSQWQNNINNVARFSLETGEFVDEFVMGVDRAMDHAWDSQGNYYLASFGTPSIIKYDRQGNRLATIGRNNLQGPVNLWINQGTRKLFAADWPTGMIKRFDLATGDFEVNFITGMQRVEGFLFGTNNSLYLCDWLANEVHEYDASSGTRRRVIPVSVLNNPNGIIYGPNVDPN